MIHLWLIVTNFAIWDMFETFRGNPEIRVSTRSLKSKNGLASMHACIVLKIKQWCRLGSRWHQPWHYWWHALRSESHKIVSEHIYAQHSPAQPHKRINNTLLYEIQFCVRSIVRSLVRGWVLRNRLALTGPVSQRSSQHICCFVRQSRNDLL